jgi:hypothetical protein
MAATTVGTSIDSPLDALEQALAAERRALLENDVDALMDSTSAKLAALRRAEQLPPEPRVIERLSALRVLNQDNGVLLARRRREVTWALRHLGRVESTGVYDANGHSGTRPMARSLGMG